MDAKRLSAAGYADQSPGRAQRQPDEQAKNRRIEIIVVPNIEDLPPMDEALKDSKEGAPAAAATPPPAPATPTPTAQ